MTEKLAGFQIAQALYAVAKLGIPEALLGGPRRISELAAHAQVEEGLLRRVVHPELGATLAPKTKGSVYGKSLFWMETHYAPFGALVDVLRTGQTAPDLVLAMAVKCDCGWP